MTVETERSCYIYRYKNDYYVFVRGQDIHLMLTSGDLTDFQRRRLSY